MLASSLALGGETVMLTVSGDWAKARRWMSFVRKKRTSPTMNALLSTTNRARGLDHLTYPTIVDFCWRQWPGEKPKLSPEAYAPGNVEKATVYLVDGREALALGCWSPLMRLAS